MAPDPASWALPAIRLPSPPRSETGWVTSDTDTGCGPPHDSGGRPCAAGTRPHKMERTHRPPTGAVSLCRPAWTTTLTRPAARLGPDLAAGRRPRHSRAQELSSRTGIRLISV